MTSRWLYILRSAPYASPRFSEAIDALLVAGVFDQHVAVLMIDEAVEALRPGQDGALLGTKTAGKQLTALADYDVREVYVCADSARARRIEDTVIDVQMIDPGAQADLIANSCHVFCD